eukprot:363291-Chlamydomonas_euryale.AAC.34
MQHAMRTHDENADASILGPAPRMGKENASLNGSFGSASGSKGLGSALKPMQQSSSRSARRPLGNITNALANAPSQENSHSGEFKRKGVVAAPDNSFRRPLGDITNAARRSTVLERGLVKPPSGNTGSSAGLSLRTPAPAGEASSAAKQGSASAKQGLSFVQARAEALALETSGVERSAGKGWAALESERARDEDARINARVRGLSAPLAAWHRSPALTALEVRPTASVMCLRRQAAKKGDWGVKGL